MKKKSASASAGRRRLLQGAALIGAAAVVPSLAANAQNQPKVTVMSADTANKPTREMTADEIRTAWNSTDTVRRDAATEARADVWEKGAATQHGEHWLQWLYLGSSIGRIR